MSRFNTGNWPVCSHLGCEAPGKIGRFIAEKGFNLPFCNEHLYSEEYVDKAALAAAAEKAQTEGEVAA